MRTNPGHAVDMPSDLTNFPARDLDAVLRRIDAQTQAAMDAIEHARDFAFELRALRGHGSADGVDVVVDHVGLTLGVTYTDRVTRLEPEGLARATMSALRAALDDVLAQVAERTHATWDDDAMVGRIVAEVEERFSVVPR